METGDLITLFRKQAGLTIDELVEKSGVPKGTLNKIIGGVTKAPTLDNMKAIARALDKTLADFDDLPISTKKELPLSKEAVKLANDYDKKLDKWGQKQVRTVTDNEIMRIQEETAQKNEFIEELPDDFISLPLSEYKASAGTGCFLFDYPTEELIKIKDTKITRKADVCITVSGDSMEPEYYDGDILLVRRQPAVEVGEIGIFIKNGNGYVKKQGENCLISLNKKYPPIPPEEYIDIICYGKVVGKVKDEWKM